MKEMKEESKRGWEGWGRRGKNGGGRDTQHTSLTSGHYQSTEIEGVVPVEGGGRRGDRVERETHARFIVDTRQMEGWCMYFYMYIHRSM